MNPKITLNNEQAKKLQPLLKVLWIICFALIAGLLTFTGIACAITKWEQANSNLDLLAIMGLGGMLMAMVAAFVVPSLVRAPGAEDSLKRMEDAPLFKQFKSTEDRQIASFFERYQTRTIVKYSILEAAGFFNVMLFFVEANLLNLVAVAVLITIMVISIPRENSVLSWIESRLDEAN